MKIKALAINLLILSAIAGQYAVADASRLNWPSMVCFDNETDKRIKFFYLQKKGKAEREIAPHGRRCIYTENEKQISYEFRIKGSHPYSFKEDITLQSFRYCPNPTRFVETNGHCPGQDGTDMSGYAVKDMFSTAEYILTSKFPIYADKSLGPDEPSGWLTDRCFDDDNCSEFLIRSNGWD